MHDALLRWNDAHSARRGVMLHATGWRNAVPLLGGRAQEIINHQVLDLADIVIALFWQRLGTPTGNYASGTVEEITRAEKSRLPVHVFFSEASLPYHSDSIEVQRVKDFRKELEPSGLLGTFTETSELVSHIAPLIESDLERFDRDCDFPALVQIDPPGGLDMHAKAGAPIDRGSSHHGHTAGLKDPKSDRKSVKLGDEAALSRGASHPGALQTTSFSARLEQKAVDGEREPRYPILAVTNIGYWPAPNVEITYPDVHLMAGSAQDGAFRPGEVRYYSVVGIRRTEMKVEISWDAKNGGRSFQEIQLI